MRCRNHKDERAASITMFLILLVMVSMLVAVCFADAPGLTRRFPLRPMQHTLLHPASVWNS